MALLFYPHPPRATGQSDPIITGADDPEEGQLAALFSPTASPIRLTESADASTAGASTATGHRRGHSEVETRIDREAEHERERPSQSQRPNLVARQQRPAPARARTATVTSSGRHSQRPLHHDELQ